MLIEIIKKIATYFLITGVIIAIGLLSYCGMLAIYPSLVLAWAAFAFAGLVEGGVFKQNIENGIENLKLLGRNGSSILIIQLLDKKLANAQTKQSILASADEGFLKDYLNLKNDIEHYHRHAVSKEQKAALLFAQKRLRRMQKYFVACVLSKNTAMQADKQIITDLQKELSSDKHQKDLSKLKRKRWLICASLPIALFSGIGFGFATASALNTALIGLGMASVGFVWPLAILACIGYVCLIYHTVSDMIANDTITTWKERVSGWFKRQGTQDHPEKKLIYALRVTGIGLLTLSILSISVLATLATAGTWWLAVKEGALLIPRIATGAIIIRDFLIPITFMTGLAFSIRNSLLSVRLIMQKICRAHPLQSLASQYHLVFKKEGLVVRLNPFKLLIQAIVQPIKASIFIGHLIATGLTGDRTPCLNQGAAVASAAIGAISDGLVDYSYITAKEECDEEGEEADNAHHHDAGHHHHDHAPFIDWVLKFALSPVYLLAATWDYFFTQEKFGTLFKKHLGTTAHTHDHDHSEIKIKSASSGWIQQELKQRFEKHIHHAKTEEEKTILRTYQARLSNALTTENKTVLNMPNPFFEKKSQYVATRKWIDQTAREYRVTFAN